ncbi:tryptophan 7-halogenase [Alteromonas sediminis]|uniref:Tryptophan 7-halogenase n=1 Tax=Alteromonas sediminis TaxID=2259342 RepID=A0A3N5YNB4_9ALTE|nr:tryptophan halogenase family protein [Alteromonas sediminis]RPJ67031.1 tryptophan 7-halogenase [Alteromonas sediminis]
MTSIVRVAIVGAGTAGWLAANHLGRTLCNRPEVQVDVIESPDVPPIGVGEGTVPNIRNTLRQFGISETEFIRRCDVTFKQSIKFVNWLDRSKHGEGNYYHHLFDRPNSHGVDATPFWLNGHYAGAYADAVGHQNQVCEAMLAPKTITTPEYEGVTGYAYHLNAAKFAALLAENAQQKYGVGHVLANVDDVVLADNGSIESLQTAQKGVLTYDFYVDCSGFNALLLGEAMNVPFVDKSDTLLIDKALAVQVPTDKDAVIPPYTVATAHQAGWIWDIALTERRGVGFVYASKYMSDEEAREKLSRYLGRSLMDLNVRHIPMKIGYRQSFWHKNCVALGLAMGFVEPLEATSILLSDFAANFLAERFPSDTSQLANLSERFNKTVGYAWDRTIDFIKLHYYLSDRADSAFWTDNRKEETVPESLKQRLALWTDYQPCAEDFFSKFEVFDLDNYLYVLYGMHYPTAPPLLSDEENHKVKQALSKQKAYAKHLVEQLPAHRALIEKIKQYGLQNV